MLMAVGCPWYRRSWIVGKWIEALLQWTDHVDIHLLFVTSDDDDREFLEAVTDMYGLSATVSTVPGPASAERDWHRQERIEYLAALRNRLVGHVRDLNPDLFLSLDSDILVPPWSEFGQLTETTYDVIAPLAYLSPAGDVITNAFVGRKGTHRRRVPAYAVNVPVDVVAAVKLIQPQVYEHVRYGYHRLGEDFYFSERLTDLGFRLGFTSTVKCKHVMKPEYLHVKDGRIGW